jgi:hypothetical protein
MAKKVKIAGDPSNVLGRDEVVGHNDDNFSLDEESQGVETMASQDASDFEDNPKDAPSKLYFGEDRCLKMFQLSKDSERGLIRVCGGPTPCKRNGHKRLTEEGAPGVYDTIKTANYVDGILSSHRTLGQQEQIEAHQKSILADVKSRLTSSTAYQERVKKAEDEIFSNLLVKDSSEGLDEEVNPDAWNDDIPEDELKMPAKTKNKTLAQRDKVKAPPSAKTMNESNLVDEVKDLKAALLDMTMCVSELVQATRNKNNDVLQGITPQGITQDRRVPVPDPEDSVSEEESDRVVTQYKMSKTKPHKKTPPKAKDYYGVARGRTPGVYTKWGEAEKQVNGFSGCLYKKFPERGMAQRFVDKNRTVYESEASETTDSDFEDSSEDDRPKGKTRMYNHARGARGGRKRRDDGTGFPPVELTGPDPSTGNSKELFRMTLAGDQSMIEKLSPPGLDAKTKEALADVTLDAIQLPGTSISEVADNTGDLVGALREMTEDRRYDWTSDRPQKDSLWKATNRTSLQTIKSEEGLRERLSEFAGLPEEMFENQVHKFSAIFSQLHWAPETVNAWANSNWFLRIGKDTLEHYVALHFHLVTVCNSEGWPYALEAQKHYATKLAQFRKTSTSRLQCLLKIYIFLRDARKNEFYSPKLQEKRNRAVLEKIAGLEAGGGGDHGASRHGCPKCGMNHSGGKKNCPLKGLSDTEARKRMNKFMLAFGRMSNEEAAKFFKHDSNEE